MGKTKFKSSWIREFPWLSPVKEDIYRAHCTICDKNFKIDGSGRSQVLSHQNSHSVENGGNNTKKKASTDPKQRVFMQSSLDGKLAMSENTALPFTEAEQISRAEIYQALHVADSNYSFNSTQMDSKRFKLRFPYSAIAQGYS